MLPNTVLYLIPHIQFKNVREVLSYRMVCWNLLRINSCFALFTCAKPEGSASYFITGKINFNYNVYTKVQYMFLV